MSGQILRFRVDLTATRLKIQCLIIKRALPRTYFPAQKAKEGCSALLDREYTNVYYSIHDGVNAQLCD